VTHCAGAVNAVAINRIQPTDVFMTGVDQ